MTNCTSAPIHFVTRLSSSFCSQVYIIELRMPVFTLVSKTLRELTGAWSQEPRWSSQILIAPATFCPLLKEWFWGFTWILISLKRDDNVCKDYLQASMLREITSLGKVLGPNVGDDKHKHDPRKNKKRRKTFSPWGVFLFLFSFWNERGWLNLKAIYTK